MKKESKIKKNKIKKIKKIDLEKNNNGRENIWNMPDDIFEIICNFMGLKIFL